MGSTMQIVFTDITDTRRFLLHSRPPIAEQLRTIHLDWGVIWDMSPDRSRREVGRGTRRDPKRSLKLYVDTWKSVTELYNVGEVFLWMDWKTSRNEMSKMTCVRWRDGVIVEGPEDVVKKVQELTLVT